MHDIHLRMVTNTPSIYMAALAGVYQRRPLYLVSTPLPGA